MATWEIDVYSALCSTKKFEINGKPAYKYDFGEQYDSDSESAEEYGCGNMVFDPKPATGEVLTKYGITVDEYNQIAEELREKLSFGGCGWCV